jgi:hypothetical protein
MSDLEHWLKENEKLYDALKVNILGPEKDVFRAIADVSRMTRSLPVALKIIRETQNAFSLLEGGAPLVKRFNEIAESIIKESQ